MTAKQFKKTQKTSTYHYKEKDFYFTIQLDNLENRWIFYIRKDYIDKDIVEHFDTNPIFKTQLQVEKYIRKELKQSKKSIQKILLRFD